MKLNRDIFETFLKSDDWTHQKTINIFSKMDSEHNSEKEELLKENEILKAKYVELKKIVDDSLKNYESSLELLGEYKEQISQLEKNFLHKEQYYKNKIVKLKSKEKIELEFNDLGNISKQILPPINRSLNMNYINNELTLIDKSKGEVMPISFSYEESEKKRTVILKNLMDFVLENDYRLRCKKIIILFCQHKIFFIQKLGTKKYDDLLNNVSKCKDIKNYNAIFWAFFNEMAVHI
jgi:hypothetical protein